MPWHNAFDVSTCLVSVLNGTTTYFSSHLAKGQTSGVFNGVAGASEPMQVGVDSSGVVTLFWETGAAIQTMGYTVTVTPDTLSVLAPGSEVVNASCYVSDGTQAGAAADVNLPAVMVPLSYSGSTPGVLPLTPNPADLSALPSPTCLAVAMGALHPVIAGRWLATNPNDNGDVWLTTDPGVWSGSAIPLTGTTALDIYSSVYDGTAVIFPGPTTKILRIPNQALGSPLSAAEVDTGLAGTYLYAASGLMFRANPGGFPPYPYAYTYSTDHGLTWNPVAVSGLAMGSICRMASGRWVAYFFANATQQLYYSDQTTPTTWTLALSSLHSPGTPNMACDGTTVLFADTNGGLYSSTDGASWTYTAAALPDPWLAGAGTTKAVGTGIFIFSGHVGNGSFYVSRNSGATWTAHTRTSSVAQGNLDNIVSHGSAVLLCWSQGASTDAGMDVSYDAAMTWSAVTPPWGSPHGKIPLCSYLG